MANSNEKLIAGLVGLLPLARDAFKDGHFDRQFNAFVSNDKVRHAGSQMIGKAEKYIRKGVSQNKLARQIAAQWAPQPSPLPTIALAVVGAGLVWAYLARKRTSDSKNNGAFKADTQNGHNTNMTVDATAVPHQ
jgi:hypothetical protein